MIHWLEIPMLSIIIAVCLIHAHRFETNKSIGPWFHFWWACVYAAPALFFTWQLHSVWPGVIFALERFIFYNPVLNLIRQRPFFYIIAKNSKPGFWDNIEMWWAGFYPYLWAFAIVAFMVVQFIHV